jgi:hypothetical protein
MGTHHQRHIGRSLTLANLAVSKKGLFPLAASHRISNISDLAVCATGRAALAQSVRYLCNYTYLATAGEVPSQTARIRHRNVIPFWLLPALDYRYHERNHWGGHEGPQKSYLTAINMGGNSPCDAPDCAQSRPNTATNGSS